MWKIAFEIFLNPSNNSLKDYDVGNGMITNR